MQFVDLAGQAKRVEKSLNDRIQKVIRECKFILGPEVKELEDRLAEFTGVKFGVGVGNWTDGLQVSMMALGIQPGDEVITSPFSFIATTETICLLGAKPVFVDIDPQTYNLDPKKLEAAITKKTKLILPVSLYGQCADYDEINAIAGKHQIPVLEDGAQSFGALYKGRRSCALTTIGGTSFFPTKPLGGFGDGGMCFTNDESLAQALREIRAHGQSKRYYHTRIGVNSRLDTLQAAILLSKFEIFEEEIGLRNEVAERYTKLLSEFVQTPLIRKENLSVWAQYSIEVDNRDKIAEDLKAQGIPTAVHYPMPLHLQPAMSYLRYSEGEFPLAERAGARVLCLPMHPYLKSSEQEQIADAIQKAIKKAA